MVFELPELPYARNALEPHISEETLDYHYGKHHQAYVDKLNELVKDTADADKSLEEIIKHASGGLFNQAAQVWNHTFYWHSLSPEGGGEPEGSLKQVIDECFGSLGQMQEIFNAKAAANFGSGWTWLVRKKDGKLDIVNTDDADTPIAGDELTPLLAVDVWEHAYYVDYRNARPKYLEALWHVMNWEFAQRNFDKPDQVEGQFRFAA